MMQKYLLHIIFASLLFVGCTKEQPAASPEAQINPIAFSHDVLKFNNMEDMHEAMVALGSIAPEEREFWYRERNNFVSQEKAAQLASTQIGRSKTQQEGNALRNAYSELFIFNLNPMDQDYTPYLPTNEVGVTMLTNAFGDVEIGGEIVNFNTIILRTNLVCSNREARDGDSYP